MLHPEYGSFADLTRQEEELGLLSQPDIGFRQAWQNLLTARRLTIVGHRISVSEDEGIVADDAPLG